jgi:4-hydroxythreonine-4-phosphate dehydrogenase
MAGREVAVLEIAPLGDPLPPPGRPDPRAGRSSYEWVVEGARLALAGRVAGLVTGPIHKGAWAAAGIPFPGHTEALREVAGVPRVQMLMAGGTLKVALATVHVALARVPSLLTKEGLLGSIRLLAGDLARRFGPARPRIAVAGLNPHAGEGGLFGREEIETIGPAVAAARAEGIDAEGPLPADACIPAAAGGRFDAVLAMFHDQGLVAVKTLAPRSAVNVTLGLPFPRTSVDHGTAFDRAGTGTATATSLRAAVRMAAEMAGRALAAETGSTGTVPGPT